MKAKTEASRPPTARDTVRIDTDKPIYQPGQTAHIRILAIGGDGRARAGAKFSIRVLDSGDTLVQTTGVATSRFGIAGADWEIPANTDPDKYHIEARAEGEDEGNRRTIEVRRYELPSFRVTARPVRPFYLLGQTPEVEVSGDYLFGKPLAGGTVKITKEDEDEALVEGVLDASGHFRASLKADLGENAFQYQPFQDLHYTAYVTDPTTNRTEERRFDVRISRDPVHLYLVGDEPSALGVRIYAAAYTPDGQVASADVEVRDGDRVLASGHTNRFGLVRFDLPPVDPAREDAFVEIRARTAAGSATLKAPVGTYPMAFQVRLETDHALYRAGEPIRCRIRAASGGLQGALLAWTEDGRVLYSQPIDLRKRAAEAAIPYRPDFPRSFTVAFVSPLGYLYDSSRAVAYPGPEELRISARPRQDVYQPGQPAAVTFQASTGKGAAVEAALGIAVVDQSVFERAETDRNPRRGWFDSWDFDRESRVGGIAAGDLLDLPPEKIDADYQLVAEALLAAGSPMPSEETFADEQASAFEEAAAKGLAEVVKRLDEEYHRTLSYPTDRESLMAVAGAALASARDPWGEPYQEKFSIMGDSAVLEFESAGPDKQFDTDDDMLAATIKREWFLPYKAAIREVLDRLKDYPATFEEVAALLDQAGIRFGRLRDPWGNPLSGGVYDRGDTRTIEIQSPGAPVESGSRNRFTLASYKGTYFRAAKEKIEAALKAAPEFPADEAQFRALLSAAGVDLDGMRDPWGHPYSVRVRTDAKFADRTRIYVYQEYRGAPVERNNPVPVKFIYRTIEILSQGVPFARGKDRSFPVARFDRLMQDGNPPATPGQLPARNLGGSGTITGVVTDQEGALIPGARISLNDTYEVRADDEARYYFMGLPAGTYTVRFSATGFKDWVVGDIPVQPGQVTRVDAGLEVAAATETVTVEAAPAVVETHSASISSGVAAATTAPIFTPHVRDYFPETLLWNPELVTDAAGKASLDFKLADSITTWRVAVIASTVDGRMAEGGAEIRAFQPFFVDLDPPQVLTVSDEISLRVPIRNYTEKQQTVAVEVAAPPELAIVQAPTQPSRIAASSAENSVIGLRAAAAASGAKLRVTARGSGAADAIEKPIAIHPFGEPVSHSVSDLVSEARPLRLDVPAGAIPGSLRAEVKLYPNLLAGVLESIEALMEKPTGCAEQTISSAYLNLMVLRGLADAGLHDERVAARARRYLLSGYQRLQGYRTGGGGFSYWAGEKPDVAVTAYAIGFLEDARGFIEIDTDVLDQERAWLSQQHPDDDATRALAVRAMASAGKPYESWVVDRLGELARTAAGMDDPYAIATFALAAMDAGKPELASAAIGRLRTLAHDEQGMAWWHLPRNTPFYGWGRAGRIESTALAVAALARWRKHAGADAQLDGLIGRGALFLLRSRDDMGCWWSTQATIRVFNALFETLAAPVMPQSQPVEVLVNGASAGRLELPGGQSVEGPVTLDVGRFLKPGAANQVSLRTPAGRLGAQARFTAWWYQPWNGPRTSGELALQVRYSAAETAVNQPVRCDVTVSRPSFRGYGMMIAEVGLPPGAEVDRGTLDDAEVDSYEVAPDHVTFYVWPDANDTRFSFVFRPRYGMRAVTAPSVLYDYYNPDARAVLPPVPLLVK